MAAGARWKVLGMAVAMAGSGAGLVAVRLVEAPGAGWVTVVVAKGLLLLGVVAIFWYVSWRLWPQRLFALRRANCWRSSGGSGWWRSP